MANTNKRLVDNQCTNSKNGLRDEPSSYGVQYE